MNKILGSFAVVCLGLGFSGCSGFKANSEDCSRIMVYINEVNALVDATNARFSDNEFRRAGSTLWSEKLDELEREVVPREPKLQEALAEWVGTSRAVATAIKPNKMDSKAVSEAIDEFKYANSIVGSMCSP